MNELQYADDNVCPAHSHEELQQSVNNYSNAYTTYGMTINKNKTKLIVQPPPGEDMPERNITIGDTNIEQTRLFPYLGSILSSQGTSSKDVENRIQAAYSAFGKLSGRVFRNKDLTSKTKLMIYNAIVVSTLLYGCETWTLYRRDLKNLELFHQGKLCSIFKIPWLDHNTNNEVLERAETISIEAMIVKHRFRWMGHVIRVEESA